MKAVKKETNDKGHQIITCEEPVFFGLFKPKKRQFIATEKYIGKYWIWKELPGKTLVGNDMFFQLNSWYKNLD